MFGHLRLTSLTRHVELLVRTATLNCKLPGHRASVDPPDTATPRTQAVQDKRLRSEPGDAAFRRPTLGGDRVKINLLKSMFHLDNTPPKQYTRLSNTEVCLNLCG